MGAKVALFFLLDSSKASAPENYGMQLPVQKVAPLYDSLNATCRFAKMNFPDSTVYGFSFFKKPHQVDMLVVLKDLDNTGRKAFEDHCHTQVAKLLNVTDAFYYADYQHRALWFPRGLQKQEFLHQLSLATGDSEPDLEGVTRKYIGDSWLMNYHRGFIFGGKSETEFSRSLAHYGLGLAYHRQMSLLTNHLAKSADLGGAHLDAVCLEASGFCAGYLFDNPVRPAHINNYESYQQITQGLKLPDLEQQLRKKLADLSQLAQIKRNRERSDSGWAERFRTENRKPAATQSQAKTTQSSSAIRNLVLALVVGMLMTVGLLSLSEEPLALLHHWLK